MSKKKAPTPKLAATNKELGKALSQVRNQLARTESKLAKAAGKAERWKEEAVAQRKAASTSGARVKKLQKKLDRAVAALAPVPPIDPVGPVSPADPVAPVEPAISPKTTAPTTGEAATTPDASWSVVQLRAEARRRGLAGMSNKPKAQLLSALS